MSVDLLRTFLGVAEGIPGGIEHSSSDDINQIWTRAWFEKRLEDQSELLSNRSFDDLLQLAADLGWELRQVRSADPGRTVNSMSIAELERLIESHIAVPHGADRGNPSNIAATKLVLLLLLESHQFAFRNHAFAGLIDRYGLSCFSQEELNGPYFRSLRMMTLLSSGVDGSAERAFSQLSELVRDHDLMRRQGVKTQHRVLKAAWHAIENESLLPGAADLLLLQASRMKELGLVDSNVHFRSSRAFMAKGDIAEADREIDEALRLSTSEILTDQYFAMKQSIVAMKSLLALQKQALDVSVEKVNSDLDERMARKHRDLQESFDSRFKALDQRLNSAVVFNLQVLAILVSAIAVGGAAWGFGVRLIDAANWRTWDLGDKVEAGGLWFTLVLVTTAIFGGLLIIVHRFVVGHHSGHIESDFETSRSKKNHSSGVSNG